MAKTDQVRELRHELRGALERYLQLESKVREVESDEFRVCIFGSARLRPDHPVYEMVYDLARRLGRMGIDIVTGGGPGLMEAANHGVKDALHEEASSIGVTIELPELQERANRHLDVKSEHRRFSSRLDEFMRLSQCVVVAPGGIGTLLELVYVWQLVQVRMIPPRPIILLGTDYWDGLLDWMKDRLLGGAYVSAGDFDRIQFADTCEEVVEIIRPEFERFNRQLEAGNGN